jgi:hypothetical protein
VGANDRDWMRVRSIYGWIRPEYIHAGTAAEQAEYARRQRVSPHDPPPIANLARLGTRAKARRRARGWLFSRRGRLQPASDRCAPGTGSMTSTGRQAPSRPCSFTPERGSGYHHRSTDTSRSYESACSSRGRNPVTTLGTWPRRASSGRPRARRSVTVGPGR